MAFVSPRMSLKIWNAPSDPYDHEQLADNFLKLDLHDHSQGRGTQIGSDGIREGAITAVHIHPGALGTITLDNESVTTDKLAVRARIPIGVVQDWWRPTTGIDIPDGWALCIGQTLEPDEHDFAVAEAVTLPDLRNVFILGADATKGVGVAASGANGAGNGPGLGGVGGSHQETLTVATMPQHSHIFRSNQIAGGVPVANLNQGEGHLRADGNDPVDGGTGYEGGGQAHNNMPRYIGLLKIMKVLN